METVDRPDRSRRTRLGVIAGGAAVLAGLLAISVLDRGDSATAPTTTTSAPESVVTTVPTTMTGASAPSSMVPGAPTTTLEAVVATVEPVSDARRPPDSVPADYPARRLAGDPLAIGDVDAPVVMVEYADFQCPYCGLFARETLPELQRRYVDEGLLRIEWRDVPYLGPESGAAATAGRAAAAQDKFWPYYEAVYGIERTPNSGSLNAAELDRIALEIGLDLEQFQSDREDATITRPISDDVVEADIQGIMTTPAFVIGDRLVLGAQPLDVFVQVIDEALGR